MQVKHYNKKNRTIISMEGFKELNGIQREFYINGDKEKTETFKGPLGRTSMLNCGTSLIEGIDIITINFGVISHHKMMITDFLNKTLGLLNETKAPKKVKKENVVFESEEGEGLALPVDEKPYKTSVITISTENGPLSLYKEEVIEILCLYSESVLLTYERYNQVTATQLKAAKDMIEGNESGEILEGDEMFIEKHLLPLERAKLNKNLKEFSKNDEHLKFLIDLNNKANDFFKTE